MNRIKDYNNGNESSEILAKQVELSRQQMDQSVNDLKNHSASDYVVEAVDWAKEKIEKVDTESIKEVPLKAWDSVSQAAKDYPLPFILGGLAIASTFLPKRENKNKQDSYRAPSVYPKSTRPNEPITSATVETNQLIIRTEDQTSVYKHDDPISETSSKASQIKDAASQKIKTAGKNVSKAMKSTSESVSDAVSSAKETVAEAKTKVTEVTDSTVQSTKSAARTMAKTTKERAHRTTDYFQKSKEHHPLSMCLGALATGLLTALVVPSSRKEDDLFGENSENLRQNLKDRAADLKDDAKAKLEDEGLTIKSFQQIADEQIEEASDKARESISKVAKPNKTTATS